MTPSLEEQKDASRQVLYLLHFDPPYRGVLHYVGITREARLLDRLREHARGKGAALTEAVLASGGTIRLAATFPCGGYEAERAFKKAGHFKDRCPLCRRIAVAPDLRDVPPIKRDPSARATALAFGRAWEAS